MFWKIKFSFFKNSTDRDGVNSRMDNAEEKINQVKMIKFRDFLRISGKK